ncbi:MAG: hypothetical protein EB072_08380 [Betaproteobacteria bacterium]|nr:hypothetical protein [Betaproteobacteria bacterium]
MRAVGQPDAERWVPLAADPAQCFKSVLGRPWAAPGPGFGLAVVRRGLRAQPKACSKGNLYYCVCAFLVNLERKPLIKLAKLRMCDDIFCQPTSCEGSALPLS